MKYTLFYYDESFHLKRRESDSGTFKLEGSNFVLAILYEGQRVTMLDSSGLTALEKLAVSSPFFDANVVTKQDFQIDREITLSENTIGGILSTYGIGELQKPVYPHGSLAPIYQAGNNEVHCYIETNYFYLNKIGDKVGHFEVGYTKSDAWAADLDGMLWRVGDTISIGRTGLQMIICIRFAGKYIFIRTNEDSDPGLIFNLDAYTYHLCMWFTVEYPKILNPYPYFTTEGGSVSYLLKDTGWVSDWAAVVESRADAEAAYSHLLTYGV